MGSFFRRSKHILSPRERVRVIAQNHFRDQNYFHHLAEIARRRQLIDEKHTKAIDELQRTEKPANRAEMSTKIRQILILQNEKLIELVLNMAGISRKREIIETWKELGRDYSPRPLHDAKINLLIKRLQEKKLLTEQGGQRIRLAFEDFKKAEKLWQITF
ncbi:MAG: hypothetical protein PHH82_02120 [Candidatus ainarchaeum sp.]|nr:hypothetical protein [Candidatus ainarchaeum sp.]